MLTKKMLFVSVAALVAIGTVFADRGILDSYRLNQKLIAEEELARQLTAENENLREKLHLLKTDLHYVEMLARNELGMVLKDEVVIHFGNSPQK